MSQRILPVALLVVLLAGMLPLKLRLDYGLGEWANDADYYYTIARSVAEGEGFKSNLSLYYQGFKTLPHHVTTSPVWPVTLGAVAAVVGLDNAARGLPLLLYLLDVVLLFVLARRLRRAFGDDADGWLRADAPIGIGLVAAFVLATNVVFFQFSSVPNNEPMAFALFFGALLCVDEAARRTHGGWAFAAGLLAGALLLTRFQALLAAASVLGVFVWLALRDRGARRLPVFALIGALLPFLPWILYLASWSDAVTLSAVMGQDTQRETPELAPFSHAFFPVSWWGFLLDRLSGVGVAFDWRSRESYVSHFGALAYLVPLALALFGWRWLRAGRGERFALTPERALPVATLLTGVGMLLPVHAAHMTFVYDWLFGFRHGLPLVVLVVLALAYLDAQPGRWWRAVAVLAAASVLVTNVANMQWLFERKMRHGLSDGEQQLVDWLATQRSQPTLVTTQPWMFGAFSRAGYHWILCRHKPEQTLALLRHAGADYVVLRRRDDECRFVEGLVGKELVEVLEFKNHVQLFALRERLGPGVLRMIESGGLPRER